MSRLIVVAVVAVILDVFALIDLRFIDSSRIRTMNKLAWALIIILVPIVGALLWFLVGRGGVMKRRPARGPKAPDDDPEFLRRIRIEQESEERIRRLEQELAELEDDSGDGEATGGSEPGPVIRGDDAQGEPPAEPSGR